LYKQPIRPFSYPLDRVYPGKVSSGSVHVSQHRNLHQQRQTTHYRPSIKMRGILSPRGLWNPAKMSTAFCTLGRLQRHWNDSPVIMDTQATGSIKNGVTLRAQCKTDKYEKTMCYNSSTFKLIYCCVCCFFLVLLLLKIFGLGLLVL
jgi:hypothetical protein